MSKRKDKTPKKRTITITVTTAAPTRVLEEIAQHMLIQLESLNDGTLEMKEGAEPVNYDYWGESTKLK